MLKIIRDDLSGEPTRSLITYHLSGMRGSSPPGHSFALGIEELKHPTVTVWSAWYGTEIAGVGALKELGNGVGEIKSMRTHPMFLRRGIGSALLSRLTQFAKQKGLRKLSLETGDNAAFDAAFALYERHGFVRGAAFSDYEQSPFNQFLHLDLE